MGKLWGNDYALATGAQTIALMGKDQTAPIVPIMAMKARVHDTSFSSILRYELIQGLSAKCERAFRFASDEANYSRGLLNHTIITDAIGLSEAKAHLEELHNQSVYIEYHHMAPANVMHAVMRYLVDQCGYNSVSGICEAESATNLYPTYVEHIHIRLSVPADVEPLDIDRIEAWEGSLLKQSLQWENPFATDPIYSVSASVLQVTIKFAYLSTTPRPGTATANDWNANGIPEDLIFPVLEPDTQQEYGYNFQTVFTGTDIPIDDFIYRYSDSVGEDDLSLDAEGDYFHTKYRLNSDFFGGSRYFMHDVEADTLPDLEATIDTSANPGSFFPLIFFRENFQTIADPDNEDTDEYKQAKALMKKLGFNYQELADKFFDPENPAGINDVSQAFMMFGIPMDSKTDRGIQYLIDFFRWLEIGTKVGTRIGINPETEDVHVSKNTSDKSIIFTEGKVKLFLKFKGVASIVKSGKFTVVDQDGEVNTARPAKINEFATREYTTSYTYSYTTLVDSVEETRWRTITLPVREFRKQVTDTQQLIVAVVGIKYTYSLSDSGGRHGKLAVVEEQKDMLIPLGHDFTTDMNFMQRQQLYAESLHVQINSYIKEKLHWYEGSNFQTFFKVVGIVLTVVSAGTAGPEVAALYATLAAATNAVVAVLIIALIAYAIQLTLDKLFQILVEEIGAKWGFIGSVILAATAAYALAVGMPQAGNLMMAATNMQRASQVQLGEDIEEYNEVLTTIQEKSDKLDERYQAYLDDKNSNTYAEQIGLLSRFDRNEPPEQFYQRLQMGANTPEILVRGPELFLVAALTMPAPGEIIN